jgi:preprotein translocase subunit SecA
LKQPLAELEKEENSDVVDYVKFYKEILTNQKTATQEIGQTIRQFGGLHVIGTERHESRRIDNQLRGRAGRQGDPGSSRFFLCLEDRLLRIFGGDQILNVMQNIGFEESTPIQSPILNKSLESAQKKVEAFYYDTRKQLFEYDQALNMQRNCVYTERRRMFEQPKLRGWLLDYAERSLDDLFLNFNSNQDDKTLGFLTNKLQNLLGIPLPISVTTDEKDLKQYLSFLKQQIQITYDLKELEMESIEKGLLREIEKSFILQQIDYSWMEHLQKITFLRESIRWRAYGQKDPLTEYKKEAFNYFLIMLARIRHRVVYFVLRSKVILL